MPNVRLFQRVALATAEELLDALSPAKGWQLWNRPDAGGWIFRGQDEARWGLTPAAMRPGCFDSFRGPSTGFAGELIDEEDYWVVQFADAITKSGIEIPGDTFELRDIDAAPERFTTWHFPPENRLGMYALAQHYRVPTRLLDWSLNPLVAAYFATVDAARRSLSHGHTSEPQLNGPRDDKMAIWAASLDFIDNVAREWPSRVRKVTVPTSNNPNLHAQSALFTLVQHRPPSDNPAAAPSSRVPDLDTLYNDDQLAVRSRDIIARRKLNVPSQPMLFKFTVPHSEARALLKYLNDLGINASTVFPGHHSAREQLIERTFYQTRRPPLPQGLRVSSLATVCPDDDD